MTRILVFTSIAPVISASIILMLLVAVVPSTDVQGAPAILNHFSSGQTSVDIEFTEVFGENYTGLSVDLPKRSNVLGVTMDLSGGLVEDKPLNRTLSTEEDWSNGTQSPKDHLVHDSRGFHLNVESINPFGDEKEISTGNNSMSVATGDLNDDGRMDVVSANMDSDTVSILTQNATGVLKVTTIVTTGDQPRTVDTGDLNGDGRTDFAVGTYGGRSVEIYTANASGGFDKTTIYVGYSVLHLKVDDVTDDGRDDIILAAYPRYGRVWRQNSDGTFTNIFSQTVTSGGYYYYTYYVRGLAIGDFNDDGRNDIAWTVSTSYTSTWEYQYYGMLKVYLQSSSGTIPSTHTWRWYAYNYAEGIAAGDVNNDGRDDIVFCNRFINKTRVMTQRSTGSMNSPVALSTRVGHPRFPEIADLDDDGDNDMLLGGGGKKIAVFRQQNGDIEANVAWVTTKNPVMTIAMDDLNGDDLTDMASSNMDGNSVSIWLQMNNFTATWTSNALIQPMMIEDITFTYLLEDAGAESRLHFSLDETNWTEIVNDTNYDIQGRPDCLWLRFVTTSPNSSTFDRLHWLKMDLICSSYPSDIQIDVGADGRVDWEMTGELNYTDEADGFEDAITAYVQDPDSLPGPGDWVNVPMTIRSETMGHLEVLGIHVTYNNASAQPMLLGPTNDTYANSTPIFRFQAADSNDDRLIYVVQITKTDFDSVFDTLTFDGRFSLYNDVPGEGFSLDRFPSGSTAEFTLPWIYALEVNQTFKWRVLAYDGHLMSEASETFDFRVDAKPPVGQAYSPSYSSTLDFIVNWSAVDDMPGSGLALSGTYDVQYRSSTDSDWTDWLIGTELVEATFSGEEAMTYHFRMRARDAVMNVGRYAEGEGDTTTTVDTLPPTLMAISPTPGQAVISGTVALKVEASDVGRVLVHGQVEYNLDGTWWTVLPLLPGDTTTWRYFLDTTLMLEGDHTVEFRATDNARHVTRVSVAFVVDNTDPTCAVISPKVGDVATGSYTVKVEAGDNLGVGAVDLVFKGIPGTAEAAATYNEQSGYWEVTVDTTLMGEGEVSMTAQTIDTSGRRSPVIGPIAFDVDNLGPSILILEPLRNDFLTGDSSLVRVAISDMHLPEVKDNVDVRIDLGAWTKMAYSSGEYRFDWYIGTVADGEHEIVVRAMDDVGLVTLGSVVARVDHNPPFLSVIDPQPEDILTGTVTLVVTVEEPFLDILQFTIDGGDWKDMEAMETTFDSSRYPDGSHNIIVRAVDLRDQETKQSLHVTFDNTPPQVVVSIPLPDEHVRGRVQFILSCIDSSGIAEVLGSTEGTDHQLEINTTSGFFEWYLDSTDLADGEHTFLFIVTDTVGNLASESRTVHVDNSPPVAELTVQAREGGIYRFVARINDSTGVDQVEVRIGDGSWTPMNRVGDGTYFHDWETGVFDNEEGVRYQVRVSDTLGNTDEYETTMDVKNPIWGLVGIVALMVLALVAALFIYLRRRSLEGEALVAAPHVDEDVVVSSEEWVEEGAEEESSSPDGERVAKD